MRPAKDLAAARRIARGAAIGIALMAAVALQPPTVGGVAQLELVATGLSGPVHATDTDDGDVRLVAERGGVIVPPRRETTAKVLPQVTLLAADTPPTAGDVACFASLSPPTRTAPVAGLPRAVAQVSARTDCAWTAVSDDDWITVTNGRDHTGRAQVLFSVSPNTGGSRTGTLTIAGRTLTVTQAGCSYGVAPSSRAVPRGGVAQAVAAVTGPSGCPWTAVSNDGWIVVASGQSGAGTGRVTYSVAPNDQSGATRTGRLTVAGDTVTITQAGCAYTLGTHGRSVAAGGIERAAVSVAAAAGCEWTASSNDAWISITSGQDGNGRGQVVYSVAPNTEGPRAGTLSIAGATFTIRQAGAR